MDSPIFFVCCVALVSTLVISVFFALTGKTDAKLFIWSWALLLAAAAPFFISPLIGLGSLIALLVTGGLVWRCSTAQPSTIVATKKSIVNYPDLLHRCKPNAKPKYAIVLADHNKVLFHEAGKTELDEVPTSRVIRNPEFIGNLDQNGLWLIKQYCPR